MSRAGQSRHAERKKPGAPRPAEGNGQPAAAPGSAAASDPAAFDAAVDAFVKRAHQEFSGVAPDSSAIGKGTYHPAPANLPWRFLALGGVLGLAAGLILALAFR